MSPTSLALLLSALGGALGALLFRSLLRFAGKVWAERKPLAVYDCADDTHRPGGFWHGSGTRVPVDPIATNGRSWEHAPQTTGSDHPHSIYGPHVNDFGKPGYYRVTFRVYGAGFTGMEEPVGKIGTYHYIPAGTQASGRAEPQPVDHETNRGRHFAWLISIADRTFP